MDLYRVTPAETRASVFLVSSEGPPHLVALYDKQGVSRTCSEPDLAEYPLSHVRIMNA